MQRVQGIDPVRLTFTDGDKCVVVTPKDNDRFVITVEAAIQACEAQQRPVRFRNQMEALLARLGQWLLEHRAEVKTGIVTVRNTDLLFIAVQRNSHYDRDLEDSLTDLDMEIAKDAEFDLVRLAVLAVPPMSQAGMSSFVCPQYAMAYNNAD